MGRTEESYTYWLLVTKFPPFFDEIAGMILLVKYTYQRRREREAFIYPKSLHLVEAPEGIRKTLLQRECKGRVPAKQLQHCLL